jgi:flagellar biosynthetic protein FlhB
MADDQGEKTEEPSQHRIDEARKKGEVASSKELNSVLLLAGCFSTLILTSVFTYEILSDYIHWLYGIDFARVFSEEEMAKEILTKTMLAAGKCIAPVFITSLVLGVLSQLFQIGGLYAPDVLEIKWSRVNPLSGFKRLFSMKALVEAAKGIFKFSIVLGITYYILSDHMTSFIGFLHSDTIEGASYIKMLSLKLSMSILVGLLLVALGDFAWEKYSYKQKLRMTKQQLKEEHKEQEGNPEIKQKIRQIQRQMATKRMAQDIKQSDVVITNPTHLSVVIKYDSTTMLAPAVMAKGADNLALQIRKIAKENDIPIVENVPLARALYKTVGEGEGVPRTLYKAVAEILAFVYRVKKKKKALS